ncbi:MAG: diphthine--ammonia ligase [Thermodesulfobacteriota bacterium]
MRASVLWTGGKDSALALYEARSAGVEIINLLTFIPEGADFLAHPLPFMRMQAQSLGLPHQTIAIEPPFEESYEKAISRLKEQYAIEALVTGDISQIDGYPNWIRERSKPSGLKVLNPLWEKERSWIMNRLLDTGFQVIFSGVNKTWLTEDWLGREINPHNLRQLEEIARAKGLDLCGEQGEYHTLVLDGPMFKQRIVIRAFERGQRDALCFLEIKEVVLQERSHGKLSDIH